MADGNQTIRWHKRGLPRKFHSSTFWITFTNYIINTESAAAAFLMHVAATTTTIIAVAAVIWTTLSSVLWFCLQIHCHHLTKIWLVIIWPVYILAPCFFLKWKSLCGGGGIVHLWVGEIKNINSSLQLHHHRVTITYTHTFNTYIHWHTHILYIYTYTHCSYESMIYTHNS